MAEKGIITHEDLRFIYDLIPPSMTRLRELIKFMYFRCGTISCARPEPQLRHSACGAALPRAYTSAPLRAGVGAAQRPGDPVLARSSDAATRHSGAAGFLILEDE